MKLEGSIVALVTPFHPDGSVHYEKLEELLKYHLNHETDGIVILGTTGEATTLTDEEKEKIISLSVEVVNHRIPLIVGAGSNDTQKAILLAEKYSKMGVDYILSITPYYNKTNDAGLIAHFQAIADHSSVPVILYNVPSRTGMQIKISVLEVLSKHKNICGIKEASGNMSYIVEVSRLISPDFVLLSGNDDIIVPMMSMGASGVISVLANICPRQTHRMCRLCLEQNYKEASRIQKDLLPVINALFYETNPIPVKAAMNALDFSVGGYRMPLFSMDGALKAKLEAILEENKEKVF